VFARTGAEALIPDPGFQVAEGIGCRDLGAADGNRLLSHKRFPPLKEKWTVPLVVDRTISHFASEN